MRIVTFTRAGSDKSVCMDADRCNAVAEYSANDNFIEIHLEGSDSFLVKGSLDAVCKLIWPNAFAVPEAVPTSP